MISSGRTSPHPRNARKSRRPLLMTASLLLAGIGGGTGLAKQLPAQDLRAAEGDLLQGRADQVIAELRSAPSTGAVHVLLCRAYLSKLRGTEAAAQCRLALQSGLANDSGTQDWAGRAFGMEAEHAGPIAGLKLAGQVRNAFQTAFDLNHGNPAAANDLGEYFVNAPFLVGGGVDKAASLADGLQATLPEITHRLRALVAERRGNTEGAEREFVAATQVAQSPGAYVDLGNFYARQGNAEKAGGAARRALALDRALTANAVDAGSILNDVKQHSQAISVLRSYLDHGQKSDAAPTFRVHTLVGQILASQGDTGNARKEFQAALALASDYAPAQKGLNSL